MDLLEVIVAKHHNGYMQERNWVPLPDEKLFHEVITDQEFVRHAHEVISSQHQDEDTLGTGWWNGHGYYAYWFRFARDTLTTLLYWGDSYAIGWQLNDTV